MRRRAAQSGGIRPNLTPMVDVVFLLIVFFIVVAQITTTERFELIPPQLRDASTTDPAEERRIVINVAPSRPSSQRVVYALGSELFSDEPSSFADLRDRLQTILARDPEIAVSIRADRAEAYEHVHPLLRLCAETGARRVNLVAEPVGGAL